MGCIGPRLHCPLPISYAGGNPRGSLVAAFATPVEINRRATARAVDMRALPGLGLLLLLSRP